VHGRRGPVKEVHNILTEKGIHCRYRPNPYAKALLADDAKNQYPTIEQD